MSLVPDTIIIIIDHAPYNVNMFFNTLYLIHKVSLWFLELCTEFPTLCVFPIDKIHLMIYNKINPQKRLFFVKYHQNMTFLDQVIFSAIMANG